MSPLISLSHYFKYNYLWHKLQWVFIGVFYAVQVASYFWEKLFITLSFDYKNGEKRTVTIFVINLNLSWIVNRLVLIRNQAFALDFKVIKIIVTTIKSKNTG